MKKPNPEVIALVSVLAGSRKKPAPLLGDREAQVLQLTAAGLGLREIAAKLKTEPKTVDNQRTSIYNKLRVDNAIKAAKLFWRAQLQVTGKL